MEYFNSLVCTAWQAFKSSSKAEQINFITKNVVWSDATTMTCANEIARITITRKLDGNSSFQRMCAYRMAWLCINVMYCS